MLSDKLCWTLPRGTSDGERGGDRPSSKPRVVGSPRQVPQHPQWSPTHCCAHRPAQAALLPALLAFHLTFSSFGMKTLGIISVLDSATGLQPGTWMLTQRQCPPSPPAVRMTGRCLGFPRAAPRPRLPLPAPPSGSSHVKSWQHGTRHLVCIELQMKNLQSEGASPGCPIQHPLAKR